MKVLNHKTKLASVTFTQGRLGLTSSAYYKKPQEERLKLRKKAYNLEMTSRRKAYNKEMTSSKGTTKKRKTTRKKTQTKKSFLERLFNGC